MCRPFLCWCVSIGGLNNISFFVVYMFGGWGVNELFFIHIFFMTHLNKLRVIRV